METVPTSNLSRTPAREPSASAPAASSAQNALVRAGRSSATPAPAQQNPVVRPEARNDDRQREVSREQLQRLLTEIEQQPAVESRSLSFRLNEDIGRTVVSVYDRETGELIRQIPSEELVRVAQALNELRELNQSGGSTGVSASGLLLEERA